MYYASGVSSTAQPCKETCTNKIPSNINNNLFLWNICVSAILTMPGYKRSVASKRVYRNDCDWVLCSRNKWTEMKSRHDHLLQENRITCPACFFSLSSSRSFVDGAITTMPRTEYWYKCGTMIMMPATFHNRLHNLLTSIRKALSFSCMVSSPEFQQVWLC